MPCGYGTVRTTSERIRHQVSRRACTEVLAALEVSCRPAQRSQQLQNLTILIVKFCSILNAPPSLQVLSGAWENALAESENTLQSSRGGWEHREVLRSTGEGYWSVWEVCVWLPDRITFCWCSGEKFFFGALTIVFCVDFVDGQDVGCCKIWTTWRQAVSFMARLVCLINLNKVKSAFWPSLNWE